MISSSAIETATQVWATDAASAKPIQSADASQILSMASSSFEPEIPARAKEA
jgi:hypothetical protein